MIPMVYESTSQARFPYFPFFVDDWLSSDDIAGFTLEQQGAYVLLLARQWKAKDGILTRDESLLAQWSKLGPRWAKVGRPIIRQCFIERGEGLINTKLRRLWEDARRRSNKATAAIETRWERERQRRSQTGT